MKNNPFADLRATLGMPDTPASPVDPAPSSASPTPRTRQVDDAPVTLKVGRVVVRYERAGRGGKEATLIEQLQLPATDLNTLLKTLKSSLGCGGSVEGDTLMLQGDHRKRLPALLSSLGSKKVVVS